MRILIIEDDKDMNSIVCKHLVHEGFDVESCFGAKQAQNMISETCYDVIVLDVMLPDGNGYDIVKWIRQQNLSTPVLFLTAMDSIKNRIYGLDAGADDYMTKPFSLEELSARVRALSRRLTDIKVNVYQIADLALDIQRRRVERGGRQIELSSREFSILEYMVRNAGIILTREQIEHYIWNYDYIGNSNIVEVYIGKLRKKIDTGYEKKLIHTIRSVGYTIKE